MFRRTSFSLLRNCTITRCTPMLTPTPVTLLSEDEKILIDTVHQFNDKYVKPRSRKMDETGVMDSEIITEAFNTGLMSIETPVMYGGGGMSFVSSILAIEELARVDPSVSVLVDVHNTLVNNTFFRYANKAQQEKYLPELANKCVGSFCLTESSSGSDAFALKTRAEKKNNNNNNNNNNRWVINGSKMYITNGGIADIFLVMATVDPSKGYKGITCFIIDKRETPGVEIVRTESKLGIKSSSTVELRFNNVEVSQENIIGEVGSGYKIAIGSLNEGRIGIAAQMIGIAQGSLDIIMPYLFQRKQFGKFIGDFQAIQMEYAAAATELHAARLLVYNAARKQLIINENNNNNNNNEKAKEEFIKEAAMAKWFASKVAEKVSSKAIEWAGGIGFMREFGLERFYRDAKIGAIYEGTSIIQLQTIAKIIKKEYE